LCNDVVHGSTDDGDVRKENEMTTWNHRVVKVSDESDECLMFAEVFYDEEGKPMGYTEPFMGSETMEGLAETLSRLLNAMNEPVLDAIADFKKPQ
jgi:hypothetical protein